MTMRAQVMSRVAAAMTVTVLTTVSALGPAHAAEQLTTDRDLSAWGSVSSEDGRGEPVGSRSAERPDHTDGNASTRGDVDGPQPESTADQKGGGANSYDCEDGPEGPYCGTDRTEDSANGKGDGEATGRPGAGTVGRADNKNPQGQEPGPEDGNRGYECDQPGDEPNQGIAEGNPAHTGCVAGAEAPEAPEEETEEETEDETEDEAPGHTEVTVCHVVGNGSYIELTFDDSALQAHLDHGDLEEVPAEGCPVEEVDDEEETPGGETPDDGDETPGEGGGDTPGNTEVTVCHVVGDGSYVELTVDDSALQAHLDHGDLEEVPAEGCPVDEVDDEEENPGGENPGGENPGGENPGGENPGEENPGEENPGGENPGEVDDEETVEDDDVLGVEDEVADDDAAEANGEGGANRAPATVAPAESVAPTSGILPATGAGDYAPILAGGALLLLAGGVLLARRRLGGSH